MGEVLEAIEGDSSESIGGKVSLGQDKKGLEGRLG